MPGRKQRSPSCIPSSISPSQLSSSWLQASTSLRSSAPPGCVEQIRSRPSPSHSQRPATHAVAPSAPTGSQRVCSSKSSSTLPSQSLSRPSQSSLSGGRPVHSGSAEQQTPPPSRLQTKLPAPQAPTASHSSPRWGHSSSVAVSQSLSSPSQASGCIRSIEPHSTLPSAAQRHMDGPQTPGSRHGSPRSSPSSTTPSQSLSAPSQRSGWLRSSPPPGCVEQRRPRVRGSHSQTPSTQGLPAPPVPAQGWPSSESSSVMPSQSLSAPSQTSVSAGCPLQLGSAEQQTPPWSSAQTWRPAPHSPTPSHAAPSSAQSSSVSPSQSSSRPSHCSAAWASRELHSVAPSAAHRHVPWPHTPGSTQSSPRPSPWSTTPSQSSSTPLHTSATARASDPPGWVEQMRPSVSGSHSQIPSRHGLPAPPTAGQGWPSSKPSSV